MTKSALRLRNMTAIDATGLSAIEDRPKPLGTKFSTVRSSWNGV